MNYRFVFEGYNQYSPSLRGVMVLSKKPCCNHPNLFVKYKRGGLRLSVNGLTNASSLHCMNCNKDLTLEGDIIKRVDGRVGGFEVRQ